jgi:hypothetical protein
MLIKEQILKIQIVAATYRLLGKIYCFKNFPILTYSVRLPGVAYTGESS